MKKNIFIILVFMGFNLSAQQLVSFSQTLENKYLTNPAVVGSTDSSPLFLGYKASWSGINDAPRTSFLTYHTKLSQNLGGVGAKLFNYTTGRISKRGVNLSYAYHFKINETYNLSLGLSASLYQMSLDLNNLSQAILDDELIYQSVDDKVVPDANFGVYFYSNELFVGLSTMQLFGRRVDMFNKHLDFKRVRHYFLNAGYNLELNSDFQLQPSVLVKYVESGFGQWDLSVKTLYKNFAWLAVGYRSDFEFAPNDIFVGLGIKYNDKIKVGYAYDYTLSDVGKVTNGSHELIFTYYLGSIKSMIE